MNSYNEVIETIMYLPIYIKDQDKKIKDLLTKVEINEKNIKVGI